MFVLRPMVMLFDVASHDCTEPDARVFIQDDVADHGGTGRDVAATTEGGREMPSSV